MPFIMTLKRLLPLPTVDWYCGFPREPHLSGWCLVPSYADGGLSMDWFQQVEHEKAWCNEFLISLHEGLVLLACSCWKPPRCEEAQAATGRGPCGRRLRPPADSIHWAQASDKHPCPATGVRLLKSSSHSRALADTTWSRTGQSTHRMMWNDKEVLC